MKTLFEYTGLVIFLGFIILFLVKFTKSEFLKLKEWLLILLGAIILTAGYFLAKTGTEISENIGVKFSVADGFYSEWDAASSDTISDQILYDHLIVMRVPHPKIIVAQAKLESNNFNSDLFKRQNNFMGMKYSQRRVTTANGTKGVYKTYDTWRECATDYAFWQFSNNLNKLSKEDYYRYLGKVYAEDPNYVEKLKTIVNSLNF